MQENINIPDSNITTNLSFRQLVLMNMQQLTNFPYIEKDFDALTDYELLCLVVKFLNDVIANQNEQNDSITRMYESFLALQTYVNNTKDTLEDAFNNLDDYVRNYFDNLDVQEEINNKLDQMLEDGVLEQIIEQFLQLTSLICFDNVANMKDSPNLTNGSYAKTLGYYSVNDGGEALYKIRTITNEDVVDEGSIIALDDNTLIAELIIDDVINIKQLGAKGDSTTDETSIIQNAINLYKKIIIPQGDYKINSLNIPSNRIIRGNTNSSSKLILNQPINIGNQENVTYNVLLENINFNGDINNLIYCKNFDYLTFNNCKFNNSNGVNNDGIIIDANFGQGYYANINNCIFSNFNNAIKLINGANANTIQNSTFYNNNTCVYIDNSEDIRILANNFENFLYQAVKIENTSQEKYSYSTQNKICFNFIESTNNVNLVTGIYLNTKVRNTILLSNSYFGLVEYNKPEIIDNSLGIMRIENSGSDPGNNIIEFPTFMKSKHRPTSFKNYTGSILFGTLQTFSDDNNDGELCLLNRHYNSGTHNYSYQWEPIPTFHDNVLNLGAKQVNNGNYVPNSITMYYNKPIILNTFETNTSGAIGYNPTYNNLFSSNGTTKEYYNKIKSLTTENRPTSIPNGTMIFDRTLNKPIWWNGTNWVDSTGTQV